MRYCGMTQGGVSWGERFFAPTFINEKEGTMIDDIRNYRAEERLKNGQPVTVRAIRPDDKERISRAFHNLEKESIYTRLFSHKTELTDGDLKKITEIDFEREVGLVVHPGKRKRRGHHRLGPLLLL